MPLALKEHIERELDRLKKDVLEKVSYSEWAAPIVIVLKCDGHLRVDGDYKKTVNTMLDVNQYPLLKLEDTFATLSGGQKFTTLDLSHANNQILLDDSCPKYVTINTHKSLFHYTRLPFVVDSTLAISNV